MENGFELLTEKEAMWAKMLIQVLEDNGVPCAALPVYGAGLVLRTGIQECLRVYVPSEFMDKAKALLAELFAGDGETEE